MLAPGRAVSSRPVSSRPEAHHRAGEQQHAGCRREPRPPTPFHRFARRNSSAGGSKASHAPADRRWQRLTLTSLWHGLRFALLADSALRSENCDEIVAVPPHAGQAARQFFLQKPSFLTRHILKS